MSRNVAGSSSSNNSGSLREARGQKTRCRSPPLSVPSTRSRYWKQSHRRIASSRDPAIVGRLEPLRRRGHSGPSTPALRRPWSDRREGFAAGGPRHAREPRRSSRRSVDLSGARRRMWRLRPAMMSSSVLLPAPLRPMIATNSPAPASKPTPLQDVARSGSPADVAHAKERLGHGSLTPWNQLAIDSATSTTRGPGTTNASSVVTANRSVPHRLDQRLSLPQPRSNCLAMIRVGGRLSHLADVDR